MPLQARASMAASNALPSGSGPSARSSGSCSSCVARDELHHAEAARIVEVTMRAVRRHVEHDVVVRSVLRAVVVIAAGRSVAVLLRDPKRARHAEMHQQHVAGGKIGEEILGAAAEPFDRLALEPGGEILRQRPAQIAAPRLDLGEARALHDRLQAAADGLDFGQFGHALTGTR